MKLYGDFTVRFTAFAEEMGSKNTHPPANCNLDGTPYYRYARTRRRCTEVFDAVHAQQCSFKPFPEVKQFLTYLSDAVFDYNRHEPQAADETGTYRLA